MCVCGGGGGGYYIKLMACEVFVSIDHYMNSPVVMPTAPTVYSETCLRWPLLGSHSFIYNSQPPWLKTALKHCNLRIPL